MDILNFTLRGPTARQVEMACRPGTNDRDVAYSILTEDEYHLSDLPLEGAALDIGAHIGAASVALALLNPTLRIIAVEPVPENIALLTRNLELNRITERVTVLHGAVGTTGRIGYHWRGGEAEAVHTFIGNQFFDPATDHDEMIVPLYTLAELVSMAGGYVGFIKIDCEGGEYGFLKGPALAQVGIIHGEVHHGPAVRMVYGKAEFIGALA